MMDKAAMMEMEEISHIKIPQLDCYNFTHHYLMLTTKEKAKQIQQEMIYHIENRHKKSKVICY